MITHSDDLSPLNTFKQNGKYASLLTKLTNPLRHILKRLTHQPLVLYRWLSPSNLTCVLQRYSRELPRILQLHKPSLLPLPYLSGTV